MKYSKHIFLLLALPFILGGGCSNNLQENEKINYEEDVVPLIEEGNQKNIVRGSCNMIEDSSHCEDYIGSMWTKEQMQLQCAGVGNWSEDACPYSENGGCRVGAGTIVENILWSYPYGGDPINEDDLYYQSQACELIEATEWVTPEMLLQQ